MKFLNCSVVVLGLCLAGVGCKSGMTKAHAESSPMVTDLETAPAPVPAYTPPTPVEPEVTSTPTMPAMTSPAMPASYAAPTVAGATKYTVRKGDTLWKIAAAHYGDGKQYNRIVAANPGLNAGKLKAGQMIMLP